MSSHYFLCGVLVAWTIAQVALGVFFVLAYTLGRREREYLLFGLLCFALAFTTAGIAYSYGVGGSAAWFRSALITHAGAIAAVVLNLHFVMRAPAEFKNMKNPVKADAESIQVGKMLYNRNCASCHGKAGLGDGPKARMLDTFSGDFSGAFFQNQTDGEHFYKTKEGRDEMPGYDKKLADDDIWNIVNYMRTFKK